MREKQFGGSVKKKVKKDETDIEKLGVKCYHIPIY